MKSEEGAMKVAVFYPWPDILERTSGASIRTGQMLEVLREKCGEITVISSSSGNLQQGNIKYVTYRNSYKEPSGVRRFLRHLPKTELFFRP